MNHYLKQVTLRDIEYLLGQGVLKHTSTTNEPLNIKLQATDLGWQVSVPTEPPLLLAADRLCVSLKTGVNFKLEEAETSFSGFVYTQSQPSGLTTVYITDTLFV